MPQCFFKKIISGAFWLLISFAYALFMVSIKEKTYIKVIIYLP